MKEPNDGTFKGGMVRDRGEGRGVRVARAKTSELAVPDPTLVLEASLALEGTNQYPNIKSPLKVRKTKLACMGIPSSVLDQGNPVYARCVRLANSYKKARQKEFFLAHGYVSSGVGALLASASLALSASRFLYEVASNTEMSPDERGGVSLPQLLKLASSLGDSSRQNELSAWELAAREAVVRKRNDQNNVASPWLTQDAAGQETRKAGRPRKEHLALTEGQNEVTQGEPEDA